MSDHESDIPPPPPPDFPSLESDIIEYPDVEQPNTDLAQRHGEHHSKVDGLTAVSQEVDGDGLQKTVQKKKKKPVPTVNPRAIRPSKQPVAPPPLPSKPTQIAGPTLTHVYDSEQIKMPSDMTHSQFRSGTKKSKRNPKPAPPSSNVTGTRSFSNETNEASEWVNGILTEPFTEENIVKVLSDELKGHSHGNFTDSEVKTVSYSGVKSNPAVESEEKNTLSKIEKKETRTRKSANRDSHLGNSNLSQQTNLKSEGASKHRVSTDILTTSLTSICTARNDVKKTRALEHIVMQNQPTSRNLQTIEKSSHSSKDLISQSSSPSTLASQSSLKTLRPPSTNSTVANIKAFFTTSSAAAILKPDMSSEAAADRQLLKLLSQKFNYSIAALDNTYEQSYIEASNADVIDRNRDCIFREVSWRSKEDKTLKKVVESCRPMIKTPEDKDNEPEQLNIKADKVLQQLVAGNNSRARLARFIDRFADAQHKFANEVILMFEEEYANLDSMKSEEKDHMTSLLEVWNGVTKQFHNFALLQKQQATVLKDHVTRELRNLELEVYNESRYLVTEFEKNENGISYVRKDFEKSRQKCLKALESISSQSAKNDKLDRAYTLCLKHESEIEGANDFIKSVFTKESPELLRRMEVLEIHRMIHMKEAISKIQENFGQFGNILLSFSERIKEKTEQVDIQKDLRCFLDEIICKDQPLSKAKLVYDLPFRVEDLSKMIQAASIVSHTELPKHLMFEEKEESGKIFHSSIDTVMELQKETWPNLTVPQLVLHLFAELQKRNVYRVEGIFRISCDAILLEKYINEVNGNRLEGVVHPSPHLYAACLKSFLRNLTRPLIPNNHYESCLTIGKQGKAGAEEINGIIGRIPRTNKNLVNLIVKFAREIASPENVVFTKMSLNNLSVIFAPSFIRSPLASPEEMLQNSQYENKFVHIMFENMTVTPIADSDQAYIEEQIAKPLPDNLGHLPQHAISPMQIRGQHGGFRLPPLPPPQTKP